MIPIPQFTTRSRSSGLSNHLRTVALSICSTVQPTGCAATCSPHASPWPRSTLLPLVLLPGPVSCSTPHPCSPVLRVAAPFTVPRRSPRASRVPSHRCPVLHLAPCSPHSSRLNATPMHHQQNVKSTSPRAPPLLQAQRDSHGSPTERGVSCAREEVGRCWGLCLGTSRRACDRWTPPQLPTAS